MLASVTLEIDRVTKRFAQTLALDDLSFSVPNGRIFGFLGANGAGKTTTMRICLGILQPDAGVVRWNGTPSADLPRRTWGYLPEERGLYPADGRPRPARLLRLALRRGRRPRPGARHSTGWPASASPTTPTGAPRS